MTSFKKALHSIDVETGFDIDHNSWRTIKVITLSTPVSLIMNRTYYLGFRVNRASRPLKLNTTLCEYSDGKNNMGDDIWFKFQGPL